ncbi:hypothetical protein J5N97_021960 [Dioscorea zingiberensis]|uniref:Uncharacterized protein n=1 Tax=Dioscorea zingiberensis TaxID=325984 RepID=A0A9D5CAA1_9LILI|nr:hypothetical protein J5N97_021960 [Dioscorea zingiberensis]
MSRPHDGQRAFHWNPFRAFLPKRPYQSPELLALLHSFEQQLAEGLRKLKPEDKADVLSLSWMRKAVETLSETHDNIKTLITDLKFPSYDWDEKWIEMYLDDSVKLLDICIALISEIARLDQGQLLLQYSLHLLDASNKYPAEKAKKAYSCLHDWMQKVSSRNPKLETWSTALQSLKGTLFVGKTKNTDKGKILERAMYGVKVVTVFICSLLLSAFSGCSKLLLLDLQVPNKFLWAEAFTDLQAYVNREVPSLFSSGKVVIPRDVKAIKTAVEKLHILNHFKCDKEALVLEIHQEETQPLVKNTAQVEDQSSQEIISDLAKSADALDNGLDLLSKQVNTFFESVLSGRDALLCNLRAPDVTTDKLNTN